MAEYNLGRVVGKSAFEYALEGGYSGTEEDFGEDLASIPDIVNLVNGINPEKIGAAYAPVIVSTTLTAAGWSGGQQTITVNGVTASSCGDVYIAPTATAAQFAAFNDAQLHLTAQGTNSITLICRGTVPTVNIPIQVEVRN